MEDLTQKKCEPCEGGVDPLRRTQFEVYLDQVEGWSFTEDDKWMEREFVFAHFQDALDFVNTIGAIAEEEGHHPNIFLHSYCKVRVELYTHAIGGLSINDFVVASKINQLEAAALE